jgi:hypothetical protein
MIKNYKLKNLSEFSLNYFKNELIKEFSPMEYESALSKS